MTDGIVSWIKTMCQRSGLALGARRAARVMELVEVLPLGGRRQVALVRCGQQSFLVTMGSDAVSAPVLVQGPRGLEGDTP